MLSTEPHMIYWLCLRNLGGNVITPDSEAVFYGILDFLAKPIFGALLIWGHKDIDLARLGLSIKDYDGDALIHEKRKPVCYLGYFFRWYCWYSASAMCDVGHAQRTSRWWSVHQRQTIANFCSFPQDVPHAASPAHNGHTNGTTNGHNDGVSVWMVPLMRASSMGWLMLWLKSENMRTQVSRVFKTQWSLLFGWCRKELLLVHEAVNLICWSCRYQ